MRRINVELIISLRFCLKFIRNRFITILPLRHEDTKFSQRAKFETLTVCASLDLCGGQYWTDEYFTGTVGQHSSEKVIKEYFKNQGMKETEYVQLKLY